MHDVRVIVARKNVSGTAHIRCKLVDFIERGVYGLVTDVQITQVPADKVVCFSFTESWIF
jgi:hypothetical protein